MCWLSAGFGDIVGLLIRHGADVNASSADDSTALICAADNVSIIYIYMYMLVDVFYQFY